jgi:hypothetical protein
MPLNTYITNDLPLPLNRPLEQGEVFRPIIGRRISELRYRCNATCPAYTRNLYSFQFDNIVRRDGIQLASVFDDELSLDNSFLMLPFSKSHIHPLNADFVSDCPPVSIVPIDMSRPIITRSRQGRLIMLWVRDPDLTLNEMLALLRDGLIPTRYQNTGYDYDHTCYPFNLSYLNDLRLRYEIEDGTGFICRVGQHMPIFPAEGFPSMIFNRIPDRVKHSIFSYEPFPLSVDKLHCYCGVSWFDAAACCLWGHLENTRRNEPHVSIFDEARMIPLSLPRIGIFDPEATIETMSALNGPTSPNPTVIHG